MKTIAAVLFEIGAPLKIVELEIPPLKPGQTLVEITFSGICGTQLGEVRGYRGEDCYLPHALGHEASGIVRDIGQEVKKMKPGDRVALSWIKGSGADVPGTIYRWGETKVNSGAITTFSHFSVVSENRVNKIDPSMPFREAALLGCAAATGIGSIIHAANVRPGDSVAVFGTGGIGLCAVMGADLMNALPVIAVDVNDWKLELARELGASHIINASREDPVERIREITGGGIDYAVESAGLTSTMEQGFSSVKDRTGKLVLVGNAPHGSKISLDPHGFNMGKQIHGTWGGDAEIDEDIPLYVKLYLAGKLKLEKLITHIYGLDEINRALDELEGGNVGRILIDMSKDV